MNYADYWQGYPETMPALDPRAGHHRGLTIDPEFATLCADAERAGLIVELGVTKHRYGNGEDTHWRGWGRLGIRKRRPTGTGGRHYVAIESIKSDGIRGSSERLRTVLEHL